LVVVRRNVVIRVLLARTLSFFGAALLLRIGNVWSKPEAMEVIPA
jgi:hypothetical protein